MKLFAKCIEGGSLTICRKVPEYSVCSKFNFKILHRFSSQPDSQEDNEEFRVLDLKQRKTKPFTKKIIHKTQVMPPRFIMMPVDQDWSNVWPGPKTFHPASVPLPVHQGYTEKGAAPPSKFGNAELMKIPNFLHLTPPAIKKQCAALKRFCTPWPANLNAELQEKQFPLQVITSDYCHSSPVIRDPLARIVTIKMKLGNLELNSHARDKLLRLVGDRYNPASDTLTITSDRCPVRQQNYDYTMYLLTALYHESWKVEQWEAEKAETDMETYIWDNNASRKSVDSLLQWPSDKPPSDVPDLNSLGPFKAAVTSIFNDGEDDYTLSKYKEATLKILSLPVPEESSVNLTS